MTIDLDLVVSELEACGLDLNDLAKGKMDGFSDVLLDVLEDNFGLESAVCERIKLRVGTK